MKIVGNSYPVHDAAGKASGLIKYAGDMRLPNMLHLTLLFSSIPHGKIISIDASQALAAKGVAGVFHCFNTSEKRFNRYRSVAGQQLPEQERILSWKSAILAKYARTL